MCVFSGALGLRLRCSACRHAQGATACLPWRRVLADASAGVRSVDEACRQHARAPAQGSRAGQSQVPARRGSPARACAGLNQLGTRGRRPVAGDRLLLRAAFGVDALEASAGHRGLQAGVERAGLLRPVDADVVGMVPKQAADADGGESRRSHVDRCGHPWRVRDEAIFVILA
jgi:hypothetical protein